MSVEVEGIRGRIMLNNDFEAWNASEGTVVRILQDKQTKIFSVTGEVETLRWQGTADDDIPTRWRGTLRNALTIYQKCLRLSEEKSEAEEEDCTARCVPGVGWCSVRGKRIQLLFDDGIRMDINLHERSIVYCDSRRRKERWKLESGELPGYIREKLDRCEVFKDVE
jgi:hypothetical protein